MPVVLAILGALLSGLFMWMVWGNGMTVLNHWLDGKAAKDRLAKDALAIADAREKAARAPLRAIEDPREAVMVLLSKLAMLRGEITMEQNVLLSRIANGRLGLDGKPEHHTALAAFAARAEKDANSVVSALTPLFQIKLSPEEMDDLFTMMDEVVALHGGPTEAQESMIQRVQSRLNYRRDVS